MEWTLEERDGGIIGRPRGRIDEASWQEFADRLIEAVGKAADDGHKLVIDFSALDYMSSRGLRALTMARREADARGVSIILASPNGIMKEILAISRYDKIFEVVDDVGSVI